MEGLESSETGGLVRNKIRKIRMLLTCKDTIISSHIDWWT